MKGIKISHSGDPQKQGTSWSATLNGKREIILGITQSFEDGDGKHLGLGVGGKQIKKIPQLKYDRGAAETEWGLWAHFLWPTVVAESYGGYHMIVNAYDRARFTFGFYQLAAHTPGDNLILLFRELLALATAQTYFPDLKLDKGKVTQVIGSGTLDLEKVTLVTRPNKKKESQLLDFMKYFNPDDKAMEQTEAFRTAQLAYWLEDDPQAIAAAVRVPFNIMLRKVKAAAKAYGLTGMRPELAIWVSDITHQGRGGPAVIKAALKKKTFESQYEALRAIGSGNSDYDGRRKTVHVCIQTLLKEKKFDGVDFGKGKLKLP